MMKCNCCNVFLFFNPISFKLFAAPAGAWIAARKASSEMIKSELARRRRDRSSCSCAVVRQVSGGEMVQTQMK